MLPLLAIPLVATALQESISLYDVNLRPRCAWVFGHEGQGVDLGLLHAANLRVRIPRAVESLNVAVAAAICLFEQRRRFPVMAVGE
jgi:TrmH family RNA methyltransferase